MKKIALAAAIPLTVAAFAYAQVGTQSDPSEPVTPSSVIENSAPEEWVAIDPRDLLIMDLAPNAAGQERRVVIELIPPPFSQPWVNNVRRLAQEHWWDGTSVNRVQDNYVTQWGDVTEEKPLPEGMQAPTASYVATGVHRMLDAAAYPDLSADPAAEHTQFLRGWPIGADAQRLGAWPIHCYGYVGVGRGYAPDTGDGSALYTIIGQPQRHMDRNLAVIGRIIDGMQHLSSLPRGSGDLGFYTEEEAALRTPILSVRLGSELTDPPAYEYMDTASESFARYVNIRANRDDPFYTVQAGGIDICGIEVPVRPVSE